MDLRNETVDHDVYDRYTYRKNCVHSDTDIVIDTEVIMITPMVFEVYEYRKCPRGCHYKVFVKSHTISEDTIRDMYG
jgi:hypothetical protein